MSIAYVALGANLGDPVNTIKSAIEMLKSLSNSRLMASSSLYRTAPMGLHNQPDFINAVVALETTLDPDSLLDALQQLEQQAGRERPYRNAPRTLDLDLLLFDTVVRHTPTLTLPHPRLSERAFVIVPLAEIAPSLVSPEQLAQVAEQVIERLELPR